MVTGHISSVGSTFIVSTSYDRGSSTILRVVVVTVVQPQLKVLYMLLTGGDCR